MEELNKVQRKDLFFIDPKMLIIEEGFNTRNDYGNIEELKNSIIENGVKVPIRGYKEGDNFVIVDGHRRHRAVMIAIAEGNQIARVPFISEKKKNLEDRIFEILISNDGKPLTSLELGETYKKLQNFGYNASEIAKKIGKSVSHVLSMIDVASSSKEIKDAIKEESISATLVAEIKSKIENSEEAEEIIKVSVETLKEMGKKKVTRKDLDGLLPNKEEKKKKEEEPLHIEDKHTYSKSYSNTTPFTEQEVADLLKRQISECAKVVPSCFRSRILSTSLVI